MALLRNKKAEVIEQGSAKRRTWEIDPEATHYKNYQWWLDNGSARPVTENFCHYWRVVALWVPLEKLAQRLDKPWIKRLFSIVGILVAFGLLAQLTASFTDYVIAVAVIVFNLAYIWLSWKASTFLLSKFMERNWVSPPDWLPKLDRSLQALVLVFCLPLMLVFSILRLIILGIEWLFFEKEIHYWFIETHPRNAWWLTPLTGMIVTVSSYLVLTAWVLPVPEMLTEVSQKILQAIGLTATVVVVVIGFSFLADRIIQKQKARERALQAAIAEAQKQSNTRINVELLTTLFRLLSVEEKGEGTTYDEWIDSLVEGHGVSSVEKVYEWSPWDVAELCLQGSWLQRLLDHYRVSTLQALFTLIGEDNATGDVSVRSVGRTRRQRPLRTGFTTVIDFFALFWAYLVTKKWRICPIVTLPETK